MNTLRKIYALDKLYQKSLTPGIPVTIKELYTPDLKWFLAKWEDFLDAENEKAERSIPKI